MEEIFAWVKTTGSMPKVKVRGLKRVNWMFPFALGVYNQAGLVWRRRRKPEPSRTGKIHPLPPESRGIADRNTGLGCFYIRHFLRLKRQWNRLAVRLDLFSSPLG